MTRIYTKETPCLPSFVNVETISTCPALGGPHQDAYRRTEVSVVHVKEQKEFQVVKIEKQD